LGGENEKTEQTQWAATYLVAAGLTRRGYRVGWPMGNAPEKDLLVESPKGTRFEVDVKGGTYGQNVKKYWHIVQEKRLKEKVQPQLYFAFVRVDPQPEEDVDFFLLSHGDLIKLNAKVYADSKNWKTKKGQPYKKFPPAFTPEHLAPYRGWSALPE
jgi:hypothetical protein